MVDIERGNTRSYSVDNSLWERLRNCEISGFRREVDEKCALLGHYAARSTDDLGQPIGPIFEDDR